MAALEMLLAGAGLPVALASLYLAVLALLSRRASTPAACTDVCFDVIVPAHNEEQGVADTVASLAAIDYPRERFRIRVVADNCTDATAARARAAGAEILVRTDPQLRGKGYALAYAFERVLADGFADAVVVVDADTIASPRLLSAFAARIRTGASAVQGRYGVRNPDDSWRTRLMVIALAAFHDVRSLGRERLRLSCGLRGNGMAFTRTLLRTHPYRAFSLVEDVEYGLQLGCEGVRVAYAPEAVVLGSMVEGEAASRSQRRRWEDGRRALVRQHVPRLLRAAWQRRDVVPLDLAMDLLVPPLAQLAMTIAIGLSACALVLWHDANVSAGGVVWVMSAVGLVTYVARGWMLSGVGVRGVRDLLWVPVYMLWRAKLFTIRRPYDGRAWLRTSRGGEL